MVKLNHHFKNLGLNYKTTIWMSLSHLSKRHHGDALYFCIAIYVCDLHETISEHLNKKFPENTLPIPSDEWIHLWFWPGNQYAHNALNYTGR